MQFKRFDLLARVVEGHSRAKYDLSSSDMPGQRLSDYGGLEDCPLAESHGGGGEALRSELARLHGGGAEEYVVTAGASEANFAVFAALISPGDAVLVERPTYQPLEAIPRGLGARVTSLERSEADAFHVTADQIRRALPIALRLLVLTNLNNPTGTELSRRDVVEVADLAEEGGFYVLVDEIFRDLAFDPDVPTIGGLNEHVIVTSGMSKFYGAGGLRIGWIRAAAPVRKRIRSVLDYLSVTPAGPSEAIALTLLKHRSKTVARNRRLIEDGQKVFRAWAAAEPNVEWFEPRAHLAFPNAQVDTDRLADSLLREYDTFIAPGESFGFPGHIRVNVGIGSEILQEGLARVSQARSRIRRS